MKRSISFAIWVVGLAGIGGCTAISKDAGFADVQRLGAQRTGHRIHWNQGSDADAAVARNVVELLGRDLSADDAVEIALLNNQNLQATYEDLGIAQADLVQAGLLKNPVFDASVRFPDVAPKGADIEIAVAQDFLSLLLLPARKKLAAAQFEQAKLHVTDAVVTMASDVRAAYFKLQGGMQLVEMRQAVVQAMSGSVEAAARLREAGNITELELADQEALLGQVKLDLAAAEADVAEDREKLTALMGVWGLQTQWKIGARLPTLPGADPPRAGLESLAISQRLDLSAARQAVIVAAEANNLTNAPYLPELSVGVDGEKGPDRQTVIGPTLSLEIPLFDHGQAAISRGESQLRQAQRRYTALAVEIRSQVRAAYGRMNASRSRVEYYERTILPLRAKVVQQTQLQYNGMLVGVFQLIEAKQAQINAGREYIESLRGYWIARTDLERAVGGQLSGLAPADSPTTRPATQRGSLDGPDDSGSHHHHHGD